MLPVGITCGSEEISRCLRLSWNYISAVERAGGFPSPDVLQAGKCLHCYRLDPGAGPFRGGDVDPFSEKNLFPVVAEISPYRDEMELGLACLALEAGLPVLGICAGTGAQYRHGRDIFQDPAERGMMLEHMQKAPAYHPVHQLTITRGTRLGEILGGRTALRVNSFHHQAIRNLGEGLIISAVAADGVIEAVESTRHPFALGVQWHPEALAEKNIPGGQELFDALLQAAARY